MNYNSSDQVIVGITLGCSFTFALFYFMIGPNKSTLFGKFFGDLDKDSLEENDGNYKLMMEICQKLGVKKELDPNMMADEIFKKMTQIKNLKS
jgi:hypothetical protein